MRSGFSLALRRTKLWLWLTAGPAHTVHCLKRGVAQGLLCEAQRRLTPGEKCCQHRWLSRDGEPPVGTNSTPQMMAAVPSARLNYTALERLENISPTQLDTAWCAGVTVFEEHVHSGCWPMVRWVDRRRMRRPPRKERVFCRILFVVLVIIFLEEKCGCTAFFKTNWSLPVTSNISLPSEGS